MLIQDTGDTKNTTVTSETRGTNVRNPRPIATILALLAAAILIALIVIGSRGLRDFDSALIGYAVASVFALAALVYRYTLWLGRPPT